MPRSDIPSACRRRIAWNRRAAARMLPSGLPVSTRLAAAPARAHRQATDAQETAGTTTERTVEGSFEDIPQVRQHASDRPLWTASGAAPGRRPGVGRGPVAVDDPDAGMLAASAPGWRLRDPAGRSTSASTFQIDEDHAGGRRPLKGEVIDTEDAGRRPEVRAGGLDATQQGVRVGRHREPAATVASPVRRRGRSRSRAYRRGRLVDWA